MAAIKRVRGEDREVETLAMANCLKLLSRVGTSVNLDGRVYACKICNKQFQSSQALGGHCARHKMPQLKVVKNNGFKRPGSALQPVKVHECLICGMDFAASQALGGHMRRHRAAEGLKLPAVLKRSNSKRIFCLDLNLTPYENDLKMGFQMSSPVISFD